jgi:hypothetical protein
MVDESGVFHLSTLSLHHGSSCPCINWGINNRLVGGRSSETVSPHRYDDDHHHLIEIVIGLQDLITLPEPKQYLMSMMIMAKIDENCSRKKKSGKFYNKFYASSIRINLPVSNTIRLTFEITLRLI